MITDYCKFNLVVTSIIPAIQNALCFLEEVNKAFGAWYVTINMVIAFFLFLCKIAVIRRYMYIYPTKIQFVSHQ